MQNTVASFNVYHVIYAGLKRCIHLHGSTSLCVYVCIETLCHKELRVAVLVHFMPSLHSPRTHCVIIRALFHFCFCFSPSRFCVTISINGQHSFFLITSLTASNSISSIWLRLKSRYYSKLYFSLLQKKCYLSKMAKTSENGKFCLCFKVIYRKSDWKRLTLVFNEYEFIIFTFDLFFIFFFHKNLSVRVSLISESELSLTKVEQRNDSWCKKM